MDFIDQLANLITTNMFISLPIAFLAGFVSSLGPCIITTLPLVVGYMGNSNIDSTKKGMIYTAYFTAGITITFVMLGIITSFLGMVLLSYARFLTVILSLVMIVSALYMLDLFSFKKKQNFCSISPTPQSKGKMGIFFLGMFGGIASTPCATPVLAAILSFVASSGNMFFGATMLFFYSLGHSVIYFLASISISSVNKFLTSPKYAIYSKYCKTALAILIFIAGVYVFYMVI